jgi:hypothetical protein
MQLQVRRMTTFQGSQKNKLLQALLVTAMIALTIAGLTFAIHQVLDGGTLGVDFYVFWRAGNALLQHQDPYSAQTTVAIQTGLYGHPVPPGQDPMAFDYPLYVLFAVLPTLWLSFDWASPLWMSINLVVMAFVMIAALRNFPKALVISVPLVYNFAFALILGNFAVLTVSILLLCCALFFFNEEPETLPQIVAGALLAWCTAKPQVTWAYIGLLVLIALRRKAWTFLASFLAAGTFMLTAAFLVMPDWLGRWLFQLDAYLKQFSGDRTIFILASIIFPPAVRTSGALLLLLLAGTGTIIKFRAWWRHKIPATDLVPWLSLFTFLLLPNNRSTDQILLFLPVILWISEEKRSPAVRWVTWAAAFLSSYLALWVSSRLFPPAIQVGVFVAFVTWLVFIELNGVWTARAPRKGAGV